LPGGGSHGTRTVVLAPDGSPLVSVGSTCNVCWETDERRAAILQAAPDGSSWRVLMRGLRNAVGVAVDPATGSAWATNNGRDLMGDDTPPETLHRVTDGADVAGLDATPATVIRTSATIPTPPPAVGCAGVAQPAAAPGARGALGIAFWRVTRLSPHGSWNRSSKVGYEVLMLARRPAGPPEVLVSGFLDLISGDASGRPAGVVAADGALTSRRCAASSTASPRRPSARVASGTGSLRLRNAKLLRRRRYGWSPSAAEASVVVCSVPESDPNRGG
jgi:glucose/arabinose dehydrogenase